MASLTASYLLFLEAAKEYGWPIEDERFFRAVTVGFFAPDILRFVLGDKQAGNIESKGRGFTHFCRGKMVYPEIEALKDTIMNHHERFHKQLFPSKAGYEQKYKKVDPIIDINSFWDNNKNLFKGNLVNQIFAMGIYAALIIDKRFDEVIQRKLFNIKGQTIIVKKDGPHKDEKVNNIRSILNKLYPRMDKQLIEQVGVDQAFFDRVYDILLDYYPSELLDKAFKPYWRIPKEDSLTIKDKRDQAIITDVFDPKSLEWFYNEAKAELGKITVFKNVVSKFKKSTVRPDAKAFEIIPSTRVAEVHDLNRVPKAFQPPDQELYSKPLN